jgi:Outer mitochondrial membrane transport complex protein
VPHPAGALILLDCDFAYMQERQFADAWLPVEELPSLRHGTTWVLGFRNIVDYLRQFEKEWDLDTGLSRDARADCIA